MSDELKRLKADLEVIERYQGYSILENARADIADKIARLEQAEDPHAAAKEPEPLDPMRVLATAEKRLDDRRAPGVAPHWNHVVRDAISLLRANSGDAKPYQLRSDLDA